MARDKYTDICKVRDSEGWLVDQKALDLLTIEATLSETKVINGYDFEIPHESSMSVGLGLLMG